MNINTSTNSTNNNEVIYISFPLTLFFTQHEILS